jgi:hypothetical protein
MVPRSSPPTKLVVTPLVLISFLVSLALVDLRHSARRGQYHAEPDVDAGNQQHGGGLPLPRWLHRVVYRYRPYRYDKVGGAGPSPAVSPGSLGGPGTPGSSGIGGGEAEDYYHSKQRKLMKMEAAEAFEIRGTVLVVLSLMSLVGVWVAWRAVCWGVGVVRGLIF